MTECQTGYQDSSPALEAQIMKLHSRLEEVVASGRRRQLATVLAMTGLVLATGMYLWYLAARIAEFADARTVVALAAAQVEPQLSIEANRFGDTLEAQAPAVLDQVEKLVISAPPRLAQSLHDYVSSCLDPHLSELEMRAYEIVSRSLAESITRAQEQGIDLTDESRFDALVETAAPAMREELKEALDEIYSEYSDSSAGMVAYIEQLIAPGDREQLTPVQESQREVLLTGLAIIKRLENDPIRSPLQKALGSRQ